MATAAPGLPTRFPCWCRAVYSWGGETKRDLGFIEGDLIECLNAGDGSWWMGRLFRDKRMIGLFPSNFVTVLDESFKPTVRRTSPPQPGSSDNSRVGSPAGAASKKQNKFRKPFQGYKEAAGPKGPSLGAPFQSSQEALQRPPSRDMRESFNPSGPTSTDLWNVGDSPLKRPPSRISSPQPPMNPRSRPASRMASPMPFPDHRSQPPSRMASPRPPSRAQGSSPPPPAPPPHRVAVNSQQRSQQRPMRTPSPAPPPADMNDRFPIFARTPSPGPAPPSPSIQGARTPSPLRDAMDDVMSSLQGMGMGMESREDTIDRSRSPLDPWSPEAFDNLGARKEPYRPKPRPLTSLGLGAGGSNYEDTREAYSSTHNSPERYNDGPPQINNYVQRMESRLRQMQSQNNTMPDELHLPTNAPIPPLKDSPVYSRPSHSRSQSAIIPEPRLRHKKSAYEIGREALSRTLTTRTNATNSSSGAQSTFTNSTSMTSQSIMSGHSAGQFSATSAGSLARRKLGSFNHGRPNTAMAERPQLDSYLAAKRGSVPNINRPTTPSMVSYHSSHDSRAGASSAAGWTGDREYPDSPGVLGGLATPKTKKSRFFKKIFDTAKTGAANARSSIAVSQVNSLQYSPSRSRPQVGTTGFAGGLAARDAGRDLAREMGSGGGGASSMDWVQVRRDVNRSTSPSRNERVERAERCQMMGYPAISSVDEFYETAEGDESIDGLPISEPTNWTSGNLALVDKSARFVNQLPQTVNPISLAQGYVCRPHRSDVQRLRAIFTWVSEKIVWEDAYEGTTDPRRVIQTKRGSAQDVAILVCEMCAAVGIHAEVIHGYLKTPGEYLDLDVLSQPNHYWTGVLIDGEWRIMDCSLASPTHPGRARYSQVSSQVSDPWYFLARPMEICWTHIPLRPEHQHIVPPISPDVLLSLPCACPAYFKHKLHMPTYDTSYVRIENLELVQLQVDCPAEVEIVAESEVKAFERDMDGDLFESGEIIKKRALAQAEWITLPNGGNLGPQKRYNIKALLPADEGTGVLKVYAGMKGLMHSSKDNPYSLAFAVPIMHSGDNPPYDFLVRHPTPHAMRHDLYVMQPQCQRLIINNTFVFTVRQHPSSLSSPETTNPSQAASSFENRPVSPNPFVRPTSAMSMISSVTGSSVSGSNYSDPSIPKVGREKPAKLAIQAPSGKILRLTRKADHTISTSSGVDGCEIEGTVWETVIKVGERGKWRGLVLADRSARWCVWGEWECV